MSVVIKLQIVVMFNYSFGVVLLFVWWISSVEIVGVKLLIVVVRLYVSEKLVVCMLVGIILVNVMIIVLLYDVYRNDSYSLIVSSCRNDGLLMSYSMVG